MLLRPLFLPLCLFFCFLGCPQETDDTSEVTGTEKPKAVFDSGPNSQLPKAQDAGGVLPPNGVTYTGGVAEILAKNCVTCHRQGAYARKPRSIRTLPLRLLLLPSNFILKTDSCHLGMRTTRVLADPFEMHFG